MKRLEEHEIEPLLAELGDWERQDDAITRTYRLESFPAAIAFVSRVAELAEQADHHPDIDIRYDRVTLTLSTHSAGGLTRRDFDLARKIDAAH